MKPNIGTTYMGLSLSTPFVVTSSGLTSSVDKVVKCQQAGAGAVVLKSIFEEQLTAEAVSLEQYSSYPEAVDYLSGYVQQNAVEQYVELIAQCRQRCDIPIIASINCSSVGGWVDFARHIERAGASALELNIFSIPSQAGLTSMEVEAQYMAVVEAVRAAVEIPVAVKVPQSFTSPLNIAQQLYFRGVRGVSMFNRFYSPDIDIERLRVVSGGVLSSEQELAGVLRWVAMSSAGVPLLDIMASTGVHSAQGGVKAMLAGAKAVGVCSVLYDRGVDYLASMVEEFEGWMVRRGYSSTADFVGLLSFKGDDFGVYQRAQFMRYFSAATTV